MDYKGTLNLPKTEFQMKASLPKREPEILAAWEESGLYKKIVEASKGRKKYILHDGPPYANGRIHLGHALNKILKDIIIKYKSMSGHSADYVPGWDCHGLPIELQVEKDLGEKGEKLPKTEVRKRCRAYAEKYVNIQREEFKRLGIFGEWDAPYLTMDFSYQADILRELGKFISKGLIYKGKKPVHWCSSCQTALAEAEVEYADKTSPAVYVKFKVKDPKGVFEVDPEKGTFFVIWTTTPWTLPANLAIALHPDLFYRLIRTPDGDLILEQNLIKTCIKKFGYKEGEYEVTPAGWTGAELDKEIVCRHPWIDRDVNVILGDHVTSEAGTGCVHIAPGHGQDDYTLGVKHGLDVYAPVDNRGIFTDDVERYAGEFVFKANAAIVRDLAADGSLIYSEELTHSYPHCWRCKRPIIFRATEQWFVSMDTGVAGGGGGAGAGTLREKALEAIDRVRWIPAWGRDRIHNMIENRPDWCLSRQRAWGVPIPALHCKECGYSFLDERLIEGLAAAFEKHGADIWFEKGLDELTPEPIVCPQCMSSDLIKEEDIIDVWFDSGVSFAAVCERRDNLKTPADLYLEGSDQHRGWFHSSLLLSVATRDGAAPYEAVLTHGFVVDGDGRKMSKSLGNVIAPGEVIDRYGVEVLRLWVAGEDYREDIRISEEILKRLSEAYRRIRNTFRYILGNLYDFDPHSDAVAYQELEEIDRLTLHRLEKLTRRVLKAYSDFEFHVIYHSVHNFCAVDLSSFYLDTIKDRLYTASAASKERRSAQTVLYHVLDTLLRLLAPVLVFTTDEAWGFMPKRDRESVHLSLMPEVREDWIDEELEKNWDRLLLIKDAVSKTLEAARQGKLIGHSLDAMVTLYTEAEKSRQFLADHAGTLKDILIVSSVEVASSEPEGASDATGVEGLRILVAKAVGTKCERCWHISPTVGGDEKHPTICERCLKVLD